VPVDPREGLARELAPVFADLEPVLQECARITDEATASAQRREAEAAGQADTLIATARTDAEAERAHAVWAARATAASETAGVLAEARAQADRIRVQGEQRRPELLARVLDLVRADLRALGDDTARGSRS
jgi:hypothetical protein